MTKDSVGWCSFLHTPDLHGLNEKARREIEMEREKEHLKYSEHRMH